MEFRKLRSEKVAEAKQFKLKLEHLKTIRDSAHKLRQVLVSIIIDF